MVLALAADRVFTADPADGDRAAPGCVVVDGGVIRDVRREPPPGVQVVRLEGATLLPGLVDAHTHVSIVPSLGNQIDQFKLPVEVQLATARASLLLDVYSGVTTMRIMGQELGVDFQVRDEVEAGRAVGPSLLCAGVQIAKAGSHGHALTSVGGADDIEALARRNLARGAALLKIFVTGGVASAGTWLGQSPFSHEEVRRAADVAHAHGAKLAAHAHGGLGARVAIESGVDTLEHGSLLDDELIDLARRHGVAIVGTFSILYHPAGIETGDASVPAVMAKVHEVRGQVEATWRKIVASGVTIALGSDSMHGCLAFDIIQLVRFGASPGQALRAATSVGAKVCGVPDRGALRPGLRADILAVSGNPLEDIRQIACPRLVMKQGRIVHAIERIALHGAPA